MSRLSSPRDPLVRVRSAVSFDSDEGLTHQSFADECDIGRIVDTYARTGLITHLAGGQPQFGDAPELDLHSALCVQAEIRSLELERDMAPAEPQGSSEPVQDDSGQESPSEPEAAPAASEAAENATEG